MEHEDFVKNTYPDAKVHETPTGGGLYRIVASKPDARGVVKVRPITGWTTCGPWTAWHNARTKIEGECTCEYCKQRRAR